MRAQHGYDLTWDLPNKLSAIRIYLHINKMILFCMDIIAKPVVCLENGTCTTHSNQGSGIGRTDVNPI